MSLTQVRIDEVERKMALVLGSELTVREWCGNTSLMMASLLKSNGEKPVDLEQMIALNIFFTGVIKKAYNVDQEIMDLEMNKCYRIMEQMVEQTPAAPEAPAPHIGGGIGEVLGQMLGEMTPIHPQQDVVDAMDSLAKHPEEEFVDEGLSGIFDDEVDDE